MSNSFYKDKVVWIIGASFGIGEALFYQFDQAGAKLIVSARSQDKINEMVKENNHLALQLDVVKSTDFFDCVAEINKKFDKIDLIIFCAGTYSPMSLNNFDLAKSKEIIEVNLVGCFNLLAAILPKIQSNKLSHLAIISSVAGYFGMPNSLAYGASQATLSNLVESLFCELKAYQIKVTLINPGFVKTRLTDLNKFQMPFITTPDKIATHIIKKLQSKNFEIYFPRLFALLMKFIKALPIKLRSKIIG